MRRVLRFAVVLTGGLTFLTIVGYGSLNWVTQHWLAKDLRARSATAISSAQEQLERSWSSDPEALRALLRDITKEQRLIASSACTIDGEAVASTDGWPAELSCAPAVGRLRDDRKDWPRRWTETVELPGGTAQLDAVAVGPQQQPAGVVLLLHDVAFIHRQVGLARGIVVAMFFAICVGAAIVTIVAARTAWFGWTGEQMEEVEAGDEQPEDFRPLPRDVRSLVDRLDRERRREARSGPWDPERLRAALRQHLQGERLVVLANREPYIHQKVEDRIEVLHPASGLVTALEPIMRACSGVWVAHGAGSADRETADESGHVRVPPGEESYTVRRVWLTEEEEKGYYYGFANEGLWPLCHVADARPMFREENWQHYVQVNQRFADAVCEEVDTDDPIVLVQDYHFALVPRMIRERLPRATIIAFWHIPWPSAERIGICPWSEELIDGLLGSSIVGFHTRQHCNNFIDSVDAFVESRIDREANAIVQGPRRTLVRPYPISVAWPMHWLTQIPSVDECKKGVREELGLAPDALVGVSADRLDYTKGIGERLQAVDQLLEHYPEYRGRFVFVQIAAPSRTKIERYRQLSESIEALTEEINARWATASWKPIILRHFHHEPKAVLRFFRAADLCYVASLHDGMNLTAKEFVAAREDGLGVLVLSQFTGAARELAEALIVNPYDLREVADALATALRMPPSEQRERMMAMRRLVSEFNVYRWAGRMLIDAAELRRRERITGRLATSGSSKRAAHG